MSRKLTLSGDPTLPPIHTVRGEAVVLDGDLAALYGVATGQFNRAIKRHAARFPADFAFRLTAVEWETLRCQIGILKAGRGEHRKYPPLAFTEHGALMAASLLNTERAIAMSVYVVRAFVAMRRALLADAALEVRLAQIDKTLLTHGTALRDLYAKLRPLLRPPTAPEPPKRRIGFRPEEL